MAKNCFVCGSKVADDAKCDNRVSGAIIYAESDNPMIVKRRNDAKRNRERNRTKH